MLGLLKVEIAPLLLSLLLSCKTCAVSYCEPLFVIMSVSCMIASHYFIGEDRSPCGVGANLRLALEFAQLGGVSESLS